MGDVDSRAYSARNWVVLVLFALACGGRSHLSREIGAGGAAPISDLGSTGGGTRPFGSANTSTEGSSTSSSVTSSTTTPSTAVGGRGSMVTPSGGDVAMVTATGGSLNSTRIATGGGAGSTSHLPSSGGSNGGTRGDTGPTNAGATHRANAGGNAGGNAGTNFGASAGVASLAGTTNGGRNSICNHHASMAGNAGARSERVWYVDAQRGSDQGAGTVDAPLQTLSCAARAANAFDTVRLLDGTWSLADELTLEHAAINDCGSLANVAFAPNVSLRAVHSGSARIIAANELGVCMHGGTVDGIEFDCPSDRAAFQTRSGSLQIIGSSLRHCQVFGLDIAGDAQVALLPGDLTDYAQLPNAQFARVRENASLRIHGGRVSHQFGAFSVEDAATLDLDGVTIEVQDRKRYLNFVNAVAMRGVSPTLTIRNQSVIRFASTAVYAYNTSVNIAIDGLTISDVETGFFLNVMDATKRSSIDINHLNITGASANAIIAWGDWNFALKNSAILGCASTAIILNGTGPTLFEHLRVEDGARGFFMGGPTNVSGMPLEEGSALDVKLRDVAITGMQGAAVYILGMEGDRYDLGTASSPGQNRFSGNHLLPTSSEANLVFTIFEGGTLYAVGNTWDANQQGANAAGQYVVQTPGVPLDGSGGAGPNYSELSDNRCYLRLAE